MDQKQKEYSTQFFNFIPQSLVGELNEKSNELVQEALEAIKARIVARYQGKIEPAVLEESFKKIEDKYLFGNDEVYEKAERFLCANVLRVPHHVLLPEDQVWDGGTASSGSSSKLANLKVELESLRNQIKTAKYKKAILQESLENVNELCQKQEERIKLDEELYNNCNVTDWKDVLDFSNQNREVVQKKLRNIQQLTENTGHEDVKYSSRKHCLENLNNYLDIEQYENV